MLHNHRLRTIDVKLSIPNTGGTMDKTFYFNTLYPLQDRVLQLLSGLDTGFYLSGGTAASDA